MFLFIYFGASDELVRRHVAPCESSLTQGNASNVLDDVLYTGPGECKALSNVQANILGEKKIHEREKKEKIVQDAGLSLSQNLSQKITQPFISHLIASFLHLELLYNHVHSPCNVLVIVPYFLSFKVFTSLAVKVSRLIPSGC